MEHLMWLPLPSLTGVAIAHNSSNIDVDKNHVWYDSEVPIPGSMEAHDSANRPHGLCAAIELTVGDIFAKVGAETGVISGGHHPLGRARSDKNQRTAQDLEALAEHTNRNNVTRDDVKLLTRRNPHLTAHLSLSSLPREQPDRQ